LGVGGHCIAVDPVYLLEFAREMEVEMEILENALQKKDNLDFVIAEIRNRLGSKIKNSKVQIAGLSYKPNVADVRESPSIRLIHGLRELGVEVIWHDDLVELWQGEQSHVVSSEIDLGVIVAKHDEMDLSAWVKIQERIINCSMNNLAEFPSIF
jgi:UDP-N-acetyl-D-glucosamine dehydrogenase